MIPNASPTPAPQPRALIGRVVSIAGAHAQLNLLPPHKSGEDPATVGKFAGIISGCSVIIGLISEVKDPMGNCTVMLAIAPSCSELP
jgi:hypothetical protein